MGRTRLCWRVHVRNARLLARVCMGALVRDLIVHSCAVDLGALLHVEYVGVRRPKLCTLVQWRCAQKMQAFEPRCLSLRSSIDAWVHPCILAHAPTLELTLPLDI